MSLVPYLRAWRTTPLHDREVIDGLVDRAHEGPSRELAAALAQWPGTYYWSDEPDGRHVVLTRPTHDAREAWGVHAALFIAVLISMTFSGGVLAAALPEDMTAWTSAALLHALMRGLSFSLPLLAILTCHEMGHYVTARRYQLNVSPPFFIPGPPAPYGIGTFGAFIRLRTIVNDRRQLLDVGAAGPIAGFIVAVPALWIGLAHSHPVAEPGDRKSTRLNSSHRCISYAVFCLKKKRLRLCQILSRGLALRVDHTAGEMVADVSADAVAGHTRRPD